jgi:hypothetical protein
VQLLYFHIFDYNVCVLWWQHGQNLHQLLKEYGRERMTAQLNQVLGVMKTCRDMDDFKRKFAWVFKKSPLQLSFFDLVETFDLTG